MRITFLGNKSKWPLIVLLLTLSGSGDVFSAAGTVSWLGNSNGQVRLAMADASLYEIPLDADIRGVFYDRDKHLVKGNMYVSVFQLAPSSPSQPLALCGAGAEIRLYVYEVAGVTLIPKINVLVGSCLHSLSMASQSSGEANEDSDFSSVHWSAEGFSIEWFDSVGTAGRPLSSTQYLMRDGVFTFQEVLRESGQ